MTEYNRSWLIVMLGLAIITGIFMAGLVLDHAVMILLSQRPIINNYYTVRPGASPGNLANLLFFPGQEN